MGGNDFKPMARELGVKFPKMFICISNWFQSLDRKEYFKNLEDHADEMETSLLLYLRPDLVLPKKDWGTGVEKKRRKEFYRCLCENGKFVLQSLQS